MNEESGVYRWYGMCDRAFEKVKNNVNEASILISPDSDKLFKV